MVQGGVHMATEFTVAFRCPQCGKIEFRKSSLFEFSGRKSLRISCPGCNHEALVIHTKDYKNFMMTIHCVICNIPHIYYFTRREIRSKEAPVILCCSDYDLELCFIGEKGIVESTVDKYERDLEAFIDELGYDDYFVNSEIMMECLDRLHDLAEMKGISCDCGEEDFGVTLLSDCIELRCQYCKNIHIIPAENRRDVEELSSAIDIHMDKKKSEQWRTYYMDPK